MEKQSGEERHEGLRQAVKAFSVLGGIGIYLVVFVGICVFLGNLADENLGLGYMGKLVGILIGFPGALYTLYRQLKQGNLL
jgi:hypothetical protein